MFALTVRIFTTALIREGQDRRHFPICILDAKINIRHGTNSIVRYGLWELMSTRVSRIFNNSVNLNIILLPTLKVDFHCLLVNL